MAKAGCVAVGEPAFWMGYDRSGVGSFYDYFRQLTEWEPKRTANYGIRHYAWLGINAKEAENVAFAREVIALLPEVSRQARGAGHRRDRPAQVHQERSDHAAGTDRPGPCGATSKCCSTRRTWKTNTGTRMILDILRADRRVDRSRVCIDHCEEHTIRLVLDEGYWAGITLYPTTKATPERAADMVEIYGPERILVNSSADWGPSDPLAVPKFMSAMRRRGHPESLVRRIVYENPLALMSQSRRFN